MVSVWREAFPLLAAKGWPAVLNMLVSMINSDDGLTSGMVHDLVDTGWDLAAHSRTHPDLTQLDRGVSTMKSTDHGEISKSNSICASISSVTHPAGCRRQSSTR